jgi:hypothetical protein
VFAIALHCIACSDPTGEDEHFYFDTDEMNREYRHSGGWRYLLLDPPVFAGLGGDEIGHRVIGLHRDARTNCVDANNEYINYLNIIFPSFPPN